MNLSAWMRALALVAFVVGGLVVEKLVMKPVDVFLKEARSEIREPDVGDFFADSAPRAEEAPAVVRPSRRRRPETRPFRAAETRPSDVVASIPPRPETRPAAAAVRRPASVDVLRGVFARLGLLSTDNRATNAASFDGPGLDLAATYAHHALNSVVIDPVLPQSGEMLFTFPIVRTPGTGLDFAFVLTYRSGYAYDGPVGHRWEHNWNARFKYVSGSPDTVVRYAGNRIDTYTDNNVPMTGSFTPPVGMFEKSVVRTTHGGASVIERLLQDGTLETYERLDNTSEPNWYFLTTVEHRDRDNVVTLAYDAAERLTKITDTRGRDFKLAYDGSFRVTTLSDWSSGGGSPDRSWTLAYSSGELVSVTAPGSPAPVTAFTYTNTSTHDLLTVKAPREQAVSGSAYLSMLYDGSRRVTSQTYGASGQTYAMSYDPSNKRTTEVDREGVERVYEYNAAYAITKVRHETDAGGAYFDTTTAWDASTALMTKTTYPEGNGALYQYSNGQLIASAQASAAGLASPPGNLSAQASNANYLVTVYSYRTETDWRLLTKITDPKGGDWKLERDAVGNVTSYKTPEHPSDPWSLTYDSASRLITAVDPQGRVKALAYGGTGLLASVTVDPSGVAATTAFARDQYGNVTKVTDPLSEDTDLVRNARGYVTSVTTPEGRVTEYLYDLNDVVTEVRRDTGFAESPFNDERRTVYTYSILDVVQTVSEKYGSSYGSSRTWTYAYDKEDRLTKTTLPKGNETFVVYDTRGNALTRTVAYGEAYASSEIMAYDGNGKMTESKNGLGHATTLAYDAFDRVVTVTDPEDHYRTTTYDLNGNVVTTSAFNAADAKLAETAMEYDANNRLTKRKTWAKKADLSTSLGGGSGWIDATYAYDKGDLLTQKADPCGSCGGGSGGTTAYAYDGAGRLTKTTPALNGHVVQELDDAGRTTKVSSYEIDGGTTKIYVTERTYDADGHLESVSERGGGSDTALTTTFVTDAFGNVRQSTDPNGNVAKFKFDDLGRPVTTIRVLDGADDLETYTVYDVNDNVLTRTCKKSGGDTSIVYLFDAADRVVTMKDEGGTSETYAYDKGHNVTLRTDRNTSTATCAYDKRRLLTQKTYSLATNVVGPALVTFGYDGLGRVTKAYNEDGLVQRTWNTLSRIQVESTWVDPSNDSGSGSTQRDVTYTYDVDGRVSLVAYPDTTHTVKKLYDAMGRITKIQKDEGGGGFVDVAAWTFQGPGRMKRLTLGSDRCREDLAYDAYGRAVSLTWDRLKDGTRRTTLDFRRGYDAGGRVTFERRDYFNASTDAVLNGARDFGDLYRYDQADRLTKVVRGVGYGAGASGHDDVETEADTTTDYVTRARYTLDGGGNRQTLAYDLPAGNDRGREDHVFDAENQLLTRTVYGWGGSALTQTSQTTNTFDANGAQTTNPTVKTDIENRIYEATDGGGHVWRYRYDPFGRRVERKDTHGSGTFWTRTYFDGVQPIEEAVTTAGSPPSETRAKFVRVYGPYLVDQILWSRADLGTIGGIHYLFEGCFQGDYLGSVQCVVSDIGNTVSTEGGVLEAYRYTEYGDVTFATGIGAYSSSSAGEQDFTYTGREWTAEAGLYYYRARWYRAESGLFLSRDVLLAMSNAHQYDYVDGSPISYIDPFGLQGNTPGRRAYGTGSNPAGYDAQEIAGQAIDAIAAEAGFGSSIPGQIRSAFDGFNDSYPGHAADTVNGRITFQRTYWEGLMRAYTYDQYLCAMIYTFLHEFRHVQNVKKGVAWGPDEEMETITTSARWMALVSRCAKFMVALNNENYGWGAAAAAVDALNLKLTDQDRTKRIHAIVRPFVESEYKKLGWKKLIDIPDLGSMSVVPEPPKGGGGGGGDGAGSGAKGRSETSWSTIVSTTVASEPVPFGPSIRLSRIVSGVVELAAK